MNKAKNSLTINSLKLISAGTLVQLFALLLLPLVGRIFDADEQGVITLLLGISGTLAVLANARYEPAIVIAPSPYRSYLLLGFSFVVNTAFSLFLLLLCFIARPLLLDSSQAVLASYVFYIPLLVWLSALLSAGFAWANREKQYNRMGTAQVCQGVVNNSLKVGLGFAGMSVLALLYSYLLGLLSGLLVLGGRKRFLAMRRHLTFHRMAVAAKAYSNFPRYSIFQNLIDTLMGSLLIFMLPLQYEMKMLGYLGMAQMLLRRPMQLLSEALSRVFFQRMAEMKQAGEQLSPLFRRFALRILLLALPFVVGLPWIMKPVIVFVLGAKWAPTAYIVSAMLPLVSINFLTAIFNFIPDIFAMQRAHLHVQVWMLLFEFTLILVASYFLPFERFIILYYILVCIEMSLLLRWYYKIIRRYDTKSLRQ